MIINVKVLVLQCSNQPVCFFGILYLKSGFKELKKNDTESIFVDDIENTDKSAGTSNNNMKNGNNIQKRNFKLCKSMQGDKLVIQELLKDKKKIGIISILVIVIIAFGILYLKSGFKELKKNNFGT